MTRSVVVPAKAGTQYTPNSRYGMSGVYWIPALATLGREDGSMMVTR
jgi:hypothetical protein